MAMRGFIKYLGLGVLGLALTLAFPTLRIDWFAIVLARAFLLPRRGPAWLLLAALSLLYSACSLASPWYWILPGALAAAVYLGLEKNFSLSPFFSHAALLLFLLLAQSGLTVSYLALLGRGWAFAWDDLIWGAASFGMGVCLLPIFKSWLLQTTRRLLARIPAARHVDLSRAEWLASRGMRLGRKPFGLEKGL